MNTEEQFFLSLRAVVIHMIKHVEPIYQILTPVLTTYEKGEWDALPRATQIAKVEEVAHALDTNSEVTKYFANYPHQWSRDRFSRLQADLAHYLAELKNE